MPTYEYKCANCGYHFEEFQSIVAEPIRICPRCGESTVERMINGGIGLIFKGTGFYETDYKKKSNGNGKAGKSSKSSKKKPATKKEPVAAEK